MSGLIDTLRHDYWRLRSKTGMLARNLAFRTKLLRTGILPLSPAAKCIWNWESHSLGLRFQAQEAGFLLANRETLLPHKTSDTLFVLGSGPSINSIDSHGWSEIAKHNSIGFNYFLAHSFVPTFYHMELLRKDFEMFRGCYSLRREAYLNTPFMINYEFLIRDGVALSELDFIDNKIVTAPRIYWEAKPEDLGKIFYFSQNYIEQHDSTFLLHYRGSLCLMISIGILLGYKKIILAGIDLNSTGYFFCDERYAFNETQALRQSRCEPVLTNVQALHATADPVFLSNTITIDKVLKTLDQAVLKRRGIELYIYNKGSLLNPLFPVWNDRKR